MIKNGYKIIDNFLENHIIDELYEMFKKNSDWEQINQIRQDHYKHVFKNENKIAPDESEIYSSKFSRSYNLEKNERFLLIYRNNIIDRLTKFTNLSFLSSDIRCYQLSSGDYYRSHCDDYAGDIGLILYLNKNWKYDWGGLLEILEDDEIKTIVPKYNRAVIIWHEKFKLHHCVSSVADFSQEPRYSITSFNKIN